MSIGEYIEKYLQEHQVSANELARQCGISKGYMSMIIKGINSTTKEPLIPSIKILQRLASGMGVSLNDLCAAVDSYVDLRPERQNSPTGKIVMEVTRHEQELILRYRVVDSSTQNAVSAVLGVQKQEEQPLLDSRIDA